MLALEHYVALLVHCQHYCSTGYLQNGAKTIVWHYLGNFVFHSAVDKIKQIFEIWHVQINELHENISRLRFEMNQTTIWVGHFKLISCRFPTNYTKNFQVLTNILRCQTCLNLNWIKSYDIKQLFLSPLIFNFERKNLENSWLINDHFLTVVGHFLANYINIFHKTEV